jgi:hypothetical protein
MQDLLDHGHTPKEAVGPMKVSHHAECRLHERGLSLALVQETVACPFLRKYTHGAWKCYKPALVKGSWLWVVVVVEATSSTVLTAYALTRGSFTRSGSAQRARFLPPVA